VIYLSNIIKYIITIIILIIVIIWATGKLNSSFNAKELSPFDTIQKKKIENVLTKIKILLFLYTPKTRTS
jgi:preprotein translocase subunit SecG